MSMGIVNLGIVGEMEELSCLLNGDYFLHLCGSDLAYASPRQAELWERRLRQEEELIADIEKRHIERDSRRIRGRYK